ncbi:hypothetical protein BABINDRAFT_9202 [Babjeviella inositovora NRRL Y-12698]|uniref:AAA+ ATPase domain-containing protein n=1 Tax=Babjeviella inositovora NRRL Y-12698 TaxID=984486 RepID=A0A1E3QLR8_9ASCO|nr:uncharacterized protein BABINDRAFT_9202 [Babjeviella inositovora NRRL Y-12698]ODQ78414.1 hypothetical protein BABINDRAFT_9202 [Babjeviella inositovora NRRL Y-12698]
MHLTVGCRFASTSGPHGSERRLPTVSSPALSDCSLTITDPFVIYQNYVARGILKPDEAQMRAAKEFQNLYYRVKDYEPLEATQVRFNLLLRKLETKYEMNRTTNNSRLLELLSFNSASKRERDNRAMIKVLTDEEELKNFPSPHGLLVNGDVGCGKSMLMDIFAHSLPHDSKCRWHYSNFMLWVYGEIHQIQMRRKSYPSQRLSMANEFILFEIAQKMIQRNTVLLLDEFMLPDLAAANIVKILFTFFFKLGGVLVATSNKLPDDLYSNKFKKYQFQAFLSVLQARCHAIDMNSANDYRVILSSESSNRDFPPYMVHKTDPNHRKAWVALLAEVDTLNEPVSSTLAVYGREIAIPWEKDGVVRFEFDYICKGLYGSSDYISLASRYHTFIIDNVPVMTNSMKYEARRFITLLDAIYEAKCKLLLQTDVPIDRLFFPESEVGADTADGISYVSITQAESNIVQLQNEEMFSKTFMEPYRPHTVMYDNNSEYNEPVRKEGQKEVDFKDIKAFTGDDEKFAFKRAVSRIKEMTGSEAWRNADKWVPLDISMRPWEHQNKVYGKRSVKQPTEVPDAMEISDIRI